MNAGAFGQEIGAVTVQVIYSASSSSGSVDVTDYALAAGKGTEGNEFEFSVDKWQFNLRTDQYRAYGTYTINLLSSSGYMVSPICETSFVIE